MIATWSEQDAAAPRPTDPLLFVGSSSIRRWEALAHSYTDHTPLQRGFGGAQLAEVARASEALIVDPDPRAVVVFAGTNDLAAGVPFDIVLQRFVCLRQRVGQGLGWDRPVLFLGITPTLARWDQWDQASALNEAIAALARDDEALSYVDVPSVFLQAGAPPDPALFVADGLHLSEEGYALWDSVLRPAVEAAVAPTAPAEPSRSGLAPGDRLLIDLGPSNPGDGELTPSPDHLGQHWNNWHPLEGDAEILPGEHLSALITTDGATSRVDLVVSGGFYGNGRSHGGLLWPDPAQLGALAVGSATGDFVYAAGDDHPGALWLRGLDPDQRYTLRLFASRDDPERRTTTYTVSGAAQQSVSLQTSGPGSGSGSGSGNDDDVAELQAVQPDAWGHVFIDVEITEGSYAYLSLIELTVE